MRCATLFLVLLAITGCKNLEATLWLSSTDNAPSAVAGPVDVKGSIASTRQMSDSQA
jgi:hypothetical protein